jgi:hypothetical protein
LSHTCAWKRERDFNDPVLFKPLGKPGSAASRPRPAVQLFSGHKEAGCQHTASTVQSALPEIPLSRSCQDGILSNAALHRFHEGGGSRCPCPRRARVAKILVQDAHRGIVGSTRRPPRTAVVRVANRVAATSNLGCRMLLHGGALGIPAAIAAGGPCRRRAC